MSTNVGLWVSESREFGECRDKDSCISVAQTTTEIIEIGQILKSRKSPKITDNRGTGTGCSYSLLLLLLLATRRSVCFFLPFKIRHLFL